MEQKQCKKCGRPLPEGYKHTKCEYCRNEKVKIIKKGGKVVLGAAVFLGSTVLAVATNGKIDLKK